MKAFWIPADYTAMGWKVLPFDPEDTRLIHLALDGGLSPSRAGVPAPVASE
jgi:hypothetical protein